MKDPCFAYAEGNWMGSLEIIHFQEGEGSAGVCQVGMDFILPAVWVFMIPCAIAVPNLISDPMIRVLSHVGAPAKLCFASDRGVLCCEVQSFS